MGRNHVYSHVDRLQAKNVSYSNIEKSLKNDKNLFQLFLAPLLELLAGSSSFDLIDSTIGLIISLAIENIVLIALKIAVDLSK